MEDAPDHRNELVVQLPPWNRIFCFFSFGVVLSLLVQFSQEVFNNNFLAARTLLWVGLMVGSPLGAAWFLHRGEKWKELAPLLFMAAFVWCLLGNLLFARFSAPWQLSDPSILFGNLAFFLAAEAVGGICVFIPLWFAVGALEIRLYQDLGPSPRNPFLCYCANVAGLFAGILLLLFLPIKSPQAIGFAALVFLFLLQWAQGFSRRTLWISLGLAVAASVLLGSGGFLNLPSPGSRSGDGHAGGTRMVFDTWSAFYRFTVDQDGSGELTGYYDSVSHWKARPRNAMKPSATPEPKSTKLLSRLAPGATIAILGAGGGSQLSAALMRDPLVVYAVDVMPALFPAMRSLGMVEFADPRVRLVVEDGRHFIESSGKKFDLIYLPNAESALSYARQVLDSADKLFTEEAYRVYVEHLKPGGIIAVQKSASFQMLGPIVPVFLHTMEMAGLRSMYWGDDSTFFLLAAPRAQDLDPYKTVFPPMPVQASSGASLKDDRPFVSALFVHKYVFLLSWVLALVPLAPLIWLRGFFARGGGWAPVLCGANYTILLLMIQMLLFLELPNPLLASNIGSLVFLGLTGLGTLLRDRRAILAALGLVALLAAHGCGLSWLSAVALALTLWSGSFFVTLVSRFKDLPKILVLDGVGAVLGSAAYVLFPRILGIHWFLGLAFCFFLVTFFTVHRRQAAEP